MIELYDYILSNYHQFFSNNNLIIVKDNNISLLDSNQLAVRIYRIQRLIFEKAEFDKELQILSMVQKQFSCCEIYYSSILGHNFQLVHGLGTVIGSNIEIGNNCTVFQNVTIGKKYASDKNNTKIGNNVTIYAGVKIIGNLNIGNNVVIGANSVVTRDIPDNEVWVGIPARRVSSYDLVQHKIPGR